MSRPTSTERELHEIPARAAIDPTEQAAPHPMLHTATSALGRAMIQRKLQRRAAERAARSSDEGSIHDAAVRGTSGASTALPHLDAIQRSFGKHDVSHVSAHLGAAATEASQAIGAEAYATGNDVAFAGPPSLHTAAHEAAHVVQQRGGVQLKGGVGEAGDDYEQHADTVADQVVQGKSSEALLDRMAPAGGSVASTPGVQRTLIKYRNRPVPGTAEESTDQFLRNLLFDHGLSGNDEMTETAYREILQAFKQLEHPSEWDAGMMIEVEKLIIGVVEKREKKKKEEGKREQKTPKEKHHEKGHEMESGMELESGSKQKKHPSGFEIGDHVVIKEGSESMKGRVAGFTDDEEYNIKVRVSEDFDGQAVDFEDNFRAEQLEKGGGVVKPVKQVPQQGLSITTFHPQSKGLSGSEFIKPGGKVDVTNHGFGSGIYGLSSPSQRQTEEGMKFTEDSVAKIITMKNPLYLQDSEHGTTFSRASKEMQRLCETVLKAIKGDVSALPGAIDQQGESLAMIAGLFKRIMERLQKPPIPVAALKECLLRFLSDYLKSQIPIEQPINYVLRMLGHDGLYCDNDSDNSWSRGCVAFLDPSSNTPRKTKDDRLH